MECVIYMGSEDVRRQALNVFRIEMLGGKVLNHFYALEKTRTKHFIYLGHSGFLWIVHAEGCR